MSEGTALENIVHHLALNLTWPSVIYQEWHLIFQNHFFFQFSIWNLKQIVQITHQWSHLSAMSSIFKSIWTLSPTAVDQTNFQCPSGLWYAHTKPEVSLLKGTCWQWSTYQIHRNGWQIPFSLTLSDICTASLSAHSSCIALGHIAFSLLGQCVSFASFLPHPHMNKWVSRMGCLDLFRFPQGCLLLSGGTLSI